MRGYPKHVATVGDFEKLLTFPQYKQRALSDLKALLASPEVATQVVSGTEGTGDLVAKEIATPNPRWLQKGFTTKNDVSAIISKAEK